MKQMITISQVVDELHGEDLTREDVLHHWGSIFDKIPYEYKKSVRVSILPTWDSNNETIVSYDRLENDVEEELREAPLREKAEKKRLKELQTLARLKAIYEPREKNR